MRFIDLGVFVLFSATACVDPPPDPAVATQAITVAAPQGEQDVPLPDSEPLADDTEGAAVPAAPVDATLVEKQQTYTREVKRQLGAWHAQGFTDAEIAAEAARIKREIVGDE